MITSSILEDKPTTPIEMILQTEPEAMDFFRKRYLRLNHAMRDYKAVSFHQARLGKQSFCWTGVRRYWIWEFPPIRLFINNRKGVVFEVAPDLTVDEALDAFGVYEEVMGLVRKPLLRLSEQFRLEMQGRKAAEGYEMRFPKMSTDELRDFVLRFSDGHIWTSRHVQDIGMVFMPVIFGCLSIPEKTQEKIFKNLMGNPGPEPVMTEKPEKPKVPESPKEPEKPNYREVDPKEIEQIKSNIEWQDTDTTDIDAYHAKIEADNKPLRRAYDKAMRLWAVQVADWQAECERDEINYTDAIQAWEKENEGFDAKHAKWVKEMARWNVVMYGVGEQFHRDLGCVWADEEKHNHPRGRYVNGCPSFTECCLMHRDDFTRAMQAAGLEMNRREKIKV